MISINVVLPEPDSPTIPIFSPLLIVREKIES